MVTIEQCRAARGFLGWTQQDLAESCGLSKTAINNFEKGHSDIKNESLKAIRMSFESAEVEFIGQEGVRKRAEYIETLKGSNAFIGLFDDICNTLRDSAEDVLISNIDESIIDQESSDKFIKHLERVESYNIKTKILCTKEIANKLSYYECCHQIHETSSISGITTFIYGEKVAFKFWKHSMIIIVNSLDASNAERKRFEYLWASSEKVSLLNDREIQNKTASSS